MFTGGVILTMLVQSDLPVCYRDVELQSARGSHVLMAFVLMDANLFLAIVHYAVETESNILLECFSELFNNSLFV